MSNGRTRSWKAAAIIGALVLLLGLVTACGGDDEPAADTHDMATMTTEAEPTPPPTAPAGPGEETVVEIPAAEEGLAFAVTEVTASAGTITLRSPNPSTMPHNIAMRDPQMREGQIVGQGGVSEITVELEPGTYEFYCSVPGHEVGGMVGTITVT